MKQSMTAFGRALLVPFLVTAFAVTAHAEDASTAAKTTATKPADTVKTVKPVKPEATATTADTKKKSKKKPKAERAKTHTGKTHKGKHHKAPSVCSHLDEATCGSNKACDWVVPKHQKKKSHRLQKPYCRMMSGVALKHAAKPANQSTAPAAAKAN